MIGFSLSDLMSCWHENIGARKIVYANLMWRFGKGLKGYIIFCDFSDVAGCLPTI